MKNLFKNLNIQLKNKNNNQKIFKINTIKNQMKKN